MEPFNVIEYIRSGLRSCQISASINPFSFEHPEKVFSSGFGWNQCVAAMPGAAANGFVGGKPSSKRLAAMRQRHGVFRPAIRNGPEIKEWLGLIQVRVAKFAEISE